jgi:hypothetical protein
MTVSLNDGKWLVAGAAKVDSVALGTHKQWYPEQWPESNGNNARENASTETNVAL